MNIHNLLYSLPTVKFFLHIYYCIVNIVVDERKEEKQLENHYDVKTKESSLLTHKSIADGGRIRKRPYFFIYLHFNLV
jgi:hypothetical protein